MSDHSSILIDTDPALGLPFCDVDDAIAIHCLVESERSVAGLTTCFGNARGERTLAVAQDLGRRWGLPVFRGADHPKDTQTAAVDALVAHKGVVLAIAPMTNIAAALARGAQWEQLIVLGGTQRRLPNLRPLHTTELNFALDEAAARVAVKACDVLFPMEVCRQVLFRKEQVSWLPDWMARQCAGWLRASPLMTGRRGFHPWDLLPAMWLLAPELFTLRTQGVQVVDRWAYRGKIRTTPGRIHVAQGVDSAAFVAAWRDLILAT